MASNREPFMAPSKCGPWWRLRSEGVVWGNIPLGAFVQNSIVCRVDHLSPQAAGRDIMTGQCPLCRDGSIERGFCRKCWSGRGPGSTRKDAEEVKSSARDEISPGERWFNQETSPDEQRAMFQLERELEATLKFEHGRGQ